MEQELRTLQAYLRASQADQNRGELFVNSGRAGADLEGGRDQGRKQDAQRGVRVAR
jgi:hypothetical protein